MAQQRSLAAAYLPILLAIATVFLVTGASLATLPLYVHGTLGYSAGVVGAIAGAQFASAVVSRLWAGRLSDRRGPKFAMLVGLVLTTAAGGAYVLSLALSSQPGLALAALFLGRALLGGGESFIITAGQAWGLVLAGQDRAAAVIGWAGTALYVALAIGGPVGGWLYDWAGFGAICLATLLIPILTFGLVLPLPPVLRAATQTRPTGSVLRAVLPTGIAAGFAGVGYNAMAFFAVLLFLDRGWQPTWAPFTAFALALILARLFFAGLPDRLGGLRTTILFLGLQILGLVGIALSSHEGLSLCASFLIGVGYAFLYPALGREAVRAVSPAQSGQAVGYYSAFFDLSMGLSSPLLGQIADHAGLPAVFSAAIGASVISLTIALVLLARQRRSDAA